MKISKMAKTYSSHTPASFQEVFPQFKWEFPLLPQGEWKCCDLLELDSKLANSARR